MEKLLLVASSGGHYEQLLTLKAKLLDDYEVYVITEKTPFVKEEDNTFYVKQLNRKKISFIFNFITNHFSIKKIIKKIKPDAVISTGALSTISSCLIAKHKKIKTIFIESFAKIYSPTLTGKFLYKKVDYFIVQWPEMLKVYPKALYFGCIY